MLTAVQRPTAAACCPAAPSTGGRRQQQHVGAAEARGVPHRCRSRRTFAVAAAAAGDGGVAGSAAPTAPPTPASNPRKFVFAVDGKPENEQALLWASTNLFNKGDKVYLAHCLSDPRTPATAVGSSSAATQWSPARDEQRYAKEFFLRLEHESSAMLQGRYVPLLQFKGIEHEELLLRLKVHRSAAGIAEAICSKAADLGADAVVIGSLGAGVLADFGSVARWASENSKVPALLLPPSTMDPQLAAKMAAPALVVAGADNLESLHDAFEWALQKMARPGDDVYVIHAEQLASDDDAVESRKRLVQEVFSWQQHSSAAAAPAVNIVCDVIFGSSVPDESMAEPEGESGAGGQLCKMADDLTARAVVLSHHGASMMRELMWGHLTMHCTKFCTRPLVVLEPRHVGKPQASGSGSQMGSQMEAPRAEPHEVWTLGLELSSMDYPDSFSPYGRLNAITAGGAAAAPAAASTAAAAWPKASPIRRGTTAYSFFDPVESDDGKYGGTCGFNTVSDPEPGESNPASAPASATSFDSEESEAEPPERKSTTHLEGSAAFRQPPDCELEVDGIVFPVHSAIVCNASNLLDCLLASFLPTDEEEGQGAPEAEGDSAADQPAAPLPRLVLKRAGPAGEGQPELPLTAGKLVAFLHHVYGVSSVQVDGVDDLLDMVDYLQAPHVKSVCDRELEASAKSGCMHGMVPQRIMELAARHKLPRTMAACMAGTAIFLAKGGRVHTQNLFADLNSCMELASSARETASSCLSLIGEDLKFQLLRAMVQAAYATKYQYSAADMNPKVAEGIAEALRRVPGWGDQPAAAVPHPTSYRLVVGGPGDNGSEPPAAIADQTSYLQGKSDLFISRADLEIEVDGVRFPVHSAIVARISSQLDALLAEHQPAKPGRRLRILLHRDMPAAPSGTPAAPAGEGAPGVVPAPAGEDGPPVAEGQADAQLAADAMPAGAGPAAVPAAPAPPQPQARFTITPELLLCFLRHCYCPDLAVAQDAPHLLMVADCFGAAKIRAAAAEALTDEFDRASKDESQPLNIWPFLQFATRYRLRRMMGLCAALLVHSLVETRDADAANALLAQFQPMAQCLDAVLLVVARMAKVAQQLGGAATQQLLEDCTGTVCRMWQEQAQ